LEGVKLIEREGTYQPAFSNRDCEHPMSRRSWFFLLTAIIVLFAALVQAEEPAHIDLPTLEKAVQEAIARAEPASACILVSRSEDYAALGFGPPSEKPGDLGDFKIPGVSDQENATRPAIDADRLKRLDLADPGTVPESFASGIVIDPSGLILTNYHVVRDATKVYVRLPGGKGSYADIHAADWRSDLAVLRIQTKQADLKVAPRGDAGRLKKGQFILTVANPYVAGFQDSSPSASWGIISNLRRRAGIPGHEDDRIKPLQEYATLIQVDSRQGVGVSGAGLIDLKGQLVGLTSAQAGIAGGEAPAGFAVPLDADMWRIVDKLKAGEEVEYGFIGVQMNRNPNFRNPNGVLIDSAVGGSGADQLDKDGEKKIRGGDLLAKIDGVPLYGPDDLFAALGTKLAGASVKIELVRSAVRRETTVKLAKLYTPGKSIVTHKPPAIGGIRVDYASVLYLRNPPPSLEAARIPPGVGIREVLPGSPAQAAKLQADTMITRVNGQNVNTPAEYYDAAGKASGVLTLQVTKPEGGSEEVALKLR